MDKEIDLVRRFVERLTNEYGYPSDLIQREVKFSLGKARFIADIVVYVDNSPYILVEVQSGDLLGYKEKLHKLADTVKPQYIIITNGINDTFFKVEYKNFQNEIKIIPDIPAYREREEDIGKILKENIISHERYTALLEKHERMLSVERHSSNSLETALIVYATKYIDESNGSRKFYALFDEPNENILARVLSLTNELFEKNPQLQPKQLSLNAEATSSVVFDLQNISLVKSSKSFTKSIDDIINRNVGLKASGYYVPDSVISFVLKLLKIKPNDKFLDPACGIGSFLIKAADGGADVIGFTKILDAAQVANLILLLSGSSPKCYVLDSILPRESWGTVPNIELGSVDVIATSPPFGWEVVNPENIESEISKNRMRVRYDSLMIEFALKYLKEHGRGVIIVAPSLLFDSVNIDIRKHLLRNGIIKAIISLNDQAFTPLTNINPYVILFEKTGTGTKTNSKTFVAEIRSPNEYEEVVEYYNRHLSGQSLGESSIAFITTIHSADSLDYNFLKGRLILERSKAKLIELGQIAETTSGTQIDRIRDISPKITNYFPYVNARDIGDGLVDTENTEVFAISDSDKYTASPGDILISRAGTVGKVGLVTGNSKVTMGSNVIKISLKEDNIPPEYLLGYFMSKTGQEQIKMYTRGAPISAITSSDLKKILIPIPPQERVDKVTTAIKKYLTLKTEESKILKKIKDEQSAELEKVNAFFMEE